MKNVYNFPFHAFLSIVPPPHPGRSQLRRNVELALSSFSSSFANILQYGANDEIKPADIVRGYVTAKAFLVYTFLT